VGGGGGFYGEPGRRGAVLKIPFQNSQYMRKLIGKRGKSKALVFVVVFSCFFGGVGEDPEKSCGVMVVGKLSSPTLTTEAWGGGEGAGCKKRLKKKNWIKRTN